MKNRHFLPFIAITAVTVFLTGCGSCKPGKVGPPGKYTIDVTRDESLKQASVPVDLVGINAASLPRWQAYSMSDYWKPRDTMRAAADKVELNFAPGEALTKTMDINHPKWEQWKNKSVTHVLVLANLPGAYADKEGNQDPRRQIVPLDVCAWRKGTAKIPLLINRSGIDNLTPGRTSN